MGSSVGAAAMKAGSSVFWVSDNRSQATAERAEKAGFTDLGALSEVVSRCDLIISVCPPAYAVKVAESVASHGFEKLYLDANAISPSRTKQVSEIAESAGAMFIDGGIIGLPAWEKGTTRLYLSGSRAAEVAECFTGSPLDAIVLDRGVGAASALKMAYAAYTKGTTALLGAILALAEHEGVREYLLKEWSLSLPVLAETAILRVQQDTLKAWRFIGEMKEIAETFSSAELPGDFHRAAAEIFKREASFKDAEGLPHLEDILSCLLRPDKG